MFDRILAVTDRCDLLDGVRGDASDVSDAHLQWLETLLRQSPASLQEVALDSVAGAGLTMEWQAVFQGAGVAYFRTRGSIALVCLLLDGKFPASEHAAIDAVQQSIQASRPRIGGFDLVRKHSRRPLRALVLTDPSLSRDLLSAVEYWADCLAVAYFRGLGTGASPGAGSTHPARHAATLI